MRTNEQDEGATNRLRAIQRHAPPALQQWLTQPENAWRVWFALLAPADRGVTLKLDVRWRHHKPPKLRPQWISNLHGKGRYALHTIERTNRLAYPGLVSAPSKLPAHIAALVERAAEGHAYVVDVTLYGGVDLTIPVLEGDFWSPDLRWTHPLAYRRF